MNKKNTIILIISILLLGLLIFGGTYAYWSWTSNTNKNIVFNTAKELIEYVEYDDGESTFLGDFQVSSSYNQGIHSTISIKKKDDPDVANVDLVATIKMDINDIGTNMKQSTALKWVVTSGTSSNIIEVLASGNFVGTNAGDVLTLYPNIPVTTTKKDFTVWIWLDASENPSELLTGETLDTVVWTQIDQVEGVQDSFEITRINTNYQVISATAVDNKYVITDYAVTQSDTTPTSWTSIASGDRSNIYTLKHTVSSIGTYYVWFKDSNNATISRNVSVTTVDNTAPTCTFGSWNKSLIANDKTATIDLTCVDQQSGFISSNLQISDFSVIVSNANASLTHINKTSVTNGYKYTLTLTGVSGNGTASIKLLSNKVKNSMNLGNSEVTSSTISVFNSYTISYELDGGSHSTSCGISTIPVATTYGVDVVICNPTKEGYTFTGWTSSSENGLGSDAKTGTASNPNTAWTGTATTNTYFKNLRTTSGTVTLTATWLENNYQNVDTGIYYNTLAAAMSAVASNQTIKALNGNGVETSNPTLASGKTGVKLDLNGQTVSVGTYYIYNNGGLDIYSSVDGGVLEGSNEAVSEGIILNNGTLTTNGTSSANTVTIRGLSTATSARLIGNNADKTATLNTNTLLTFSDDVATCNTSSFRYLARTDGTLNITGASLIHKDGASSCQGGIYTGNANGRIIMNSGLIQTRGVSINNYFGTNTSNPAVVINGGTVESLAETSPAFSGISFTLYSRGSTIRINDGNIKGKTVIGIYGSGDGVVDIRGGSITGTEEGILVYKGTAAIIGGTVTGGNTGVYLAGTQGNGTLIMGDDEGGVPSTTSPVISSTATSGSNYGVYMQTGSTFNFYDGKITSTRGTGYAINRTVNDTPDGYAVYKSTANGVETAILSVANYQNVDSGRYYRTLAEALSAVESNQTIKALSGNGVETSNLTLASGKTGVKFDLNGQTVSVGSYHIYNLGELDIYNSSSTEGILEGANTDSSIGVIRNGGTLTTNGTSSTNPITIRNTSDHYNARVIRNDGGTVTLNTNSMVTFAQATTGTRYLISNGGIFTIAGANLINNISSSTYDCGIINNSTSSRVIMTSGSINTYGRSINGAGRGTTIPTISISGGTITSSNGDCIFFTSSGTISITGGTITGGLNGIYMATSSTGTLIMGIDEGGTPSLTSPVISSTATSGNYYGVYNISATKFYFYDGKITSTRGTGYAMKMDPNSTAEGYDVSKSTTNGVETAILGTEAYYKNVNTGTYYYSLADALSAVASNQTIKVFRRMEDRGGTLASGKTGVKFDLNGKTIALGTDTLTNNGGLDIYTSNEGGILQGSNTSSSSGVILNNGVLTTNGTSSSNNLTIRNTSDNVDARVIVNNENKNAILNINTTITFGAALSKGENVRYLIQDNGILIIAGATLQNNVSKTDSGILISNSTSSRVVMTSGTINTSGTGIYNSSEIGTTTPAVDISGGTIISNYFEAIMHDSNSLLNISDGTITGFKYGIYCEVDGIINITGGTITGDDGIYIDGAILTLGNNDQTVSATSPVIIANKGYGIYNYGGTFNLYDGSISSHGGSGYSIYSNPDNVPNRYSVSKSVSDGVETAILEAD